MVVVSALEEIRRSRRLQIGVWVAIVSIVAAAALQIPQLVLRFIDPYKVTASQVLTPMVRQGEDVRISYDIERRRICRVDLDRFLIRIDQPQQPVVWRDRAPGGATPVGTWPGVVNAVPVPRLAPGRYRLQVTIINECPEGFHTTDAPPAIFEVVPPINGGAQ